MNEMKRKKKMISDDDARCTSAENELRNGRNTPIQNSAKGGREEDYYFDFFLLFCCVSPAGCSAAAIEVILDWIFPSDIPECLNRHIRRMYFTYLYQVVVLITQQLMLNFILCFECTY